MPNPTKPALLFIATALLLLSSCGTKEEPYYRIRVDGKIGFIDSMGNMKIKPEYILAGNFNEGLAMVVVDTVPIKTQTIAAKTYTSIADLPEIGYWSEYENVLKYGYIDRNNRFIIEPKMIYKNPTHYWQKASLYFSEGLAIFQDSSMRYGYINNRGEIIIPAKFVTASPFSGSLALVSTEVKKDVNKYGYIDLKGNTVIDYKYSWATSFSEGHAIVRYDWFPNSTDMTKDDWMDERQEAMVINEKGNIVGSPFGGFNLFSEFSNGFALEANIALNFHRYISKRGEVATGMLDKAKPFSDGLAAVFSKGKWGFVDTSFKFVIPPVYNNCDFYSEGLIPVKSGKFWGYIDRNSKVVIPFRYDSCSTFHDSRAKFKISKDGYKINGYIDRSGNVIWQKEEFIQKEGESS